MRGIAIAGWWDLGLPRNGSVMRNTAGGTLDDMDGPLGQRGTIDQDF